MTARRMDLARWVAVSLTAVLLSACSGGSGATSSSVAPSRLRSAPVEVKIAYLEDLSVDRQSVTPAFQGMRLAFSRAADAGAIAVAPDVVRFDVGGDPSKALDVVHQIAADPSFVVVAIAPFLAETSDVEILAERQVCRPSISSRSAAWRRRRLVARGREPGAADRHAARAAGPRDGSA